MDENGETPPKKSKLTLKRSPPSRGLISKMATSIANLTSFVSTLSYYE